MAVVPVRLFPTNGREGAAYQLRSWIPEIFQGMCGGGPDNRALSEGKLADEARSPAADRPGPQKNSQRGEATRAGADRMSRPGQDPSDSMGEGVRARSHSCKERAPKLVDSHKHETFNCTKNTLKVA
ncbi:MAG: hypothetical protein APF81_23210 [Desulfosporosinus sp. BRH_c37]|nr:MAG: hypothetical protein APF81_23210 [Desulfosporosinus sp. BRH_c37]